MGLKDNLELFVRLTLDASFREEAYSGSGIVAGSFRSLEAEVRRHARCLVNKRLGVVRRILGGTELALGAPFANEFRAYATCTKEPRGVNRHRLDALAFARWLATRTGEGRYPPVLLDLLAHESAPLIMWAEKRSLFLRFHRRSPAAIFRALQAGKGLPCIFLRPALVVWRKGARTERGFRWREFSL